MKEGILFYWASQGPPPPQVASMLKEKAAFLQKHDQVLFGKYFRDHLTESLKAKKQSIEALAEVNKSINKREGTSFYQGSQRVGGWGGDGGQKCRSN